MTFSLVAQYLAYRQVSSVDKFVWPVVDLHCDWTEECPIEAVATVWDVCKPQLQAYVQWALDPRDAPSYGVLGEN